MSNFFSSFINMIAIFDVIFVVLVLYFIIQCVNKGFVMSLISFLKWVLSLVITVFLIPKVEPYLLGSFRNENVVILGLGVGIYIISLFILILIGKSLGRLFSYTGLGPVDKLFGFFFGIFKGYVFAVCIFSLSNWFYSYEKWDISIEQSYFFPVVKKGGELLIDEFPSEEDLENTKEKIEKI